MKTPVGDLAGPITLIYSINLQKINDPSFSHRQKNVLDNQQDIRLPLGDYYPKPTY